MLKIPTSQNFYVFRDFPISRNALRNIVFMESYV